MADFALPHDHGRHKHDEALHRELMNTERFSAVGRMRHQHCGDDGYVEPGGLAPFEVAFRQWAYHEPPRRQGSLL